MTIPLADVQDVIIVGGGLAGLLAGQALRARGLSVRILDKGRSVGGRLATRRIGPGLGDYGAQFFTVRDPEFQQWVARWQALGLVFEWSRGWGDGSLFGTRSLGGNPRYAVQGGMNALAKHIAAGLDCRVEVTVSAIRQAGALWALETAGQGLMVGRGLLLTPPVPQALALLQAGAVALSPGDLAALHRLTYAPSLTGLFHVEGAVHIPAPGAVQRTGPVGWIADNRRKGISPAATILTVQASPEYSIAHYDDPEGTILAELRLSFELYMTARALVREAQLKRWRYALPLVTHTERYLTAEHPLPLVFAGDIFGGPRIEGAALSGLAAGAALADLMAATPG